jgi:hypothetical protein
VLKDKLLDAGLSIEQAAKATEVMNEYANKNYVRKDKFTELEEKYDTKVKAFEKLEINEKKNKDIVKKELQEEFEKNYFVKLQEELKKTNVTFAMKSDKKYSLKDDKYIDYLLGQIDYNSISLNNGILDGFTEQFAKIVSENELFFNKLDVQQEKVPVLFNGGFKLSGIEPHDGQSVQQAQNINKGNFGAERAKKDNIRSGLNG